MRIGYVALIKLHGNQIYFLVSNPGETVIMVFNNNNIF